MMGANGVSATDRPSRARRRARLTRAASGQGAPEDAGTRNSEKLRRRRRVESHVEPNRSTVRGFRAPGADKPGGAAGTGLAPQGAEWRPLVVRSVGRRVSGPVVQRLAANGRRLGRGARADAGGVHTRPDEALELPRRLGAVHVAVPDRR